MFQKALCDVQSLSALVSVCPLAFGIVAVGVVRPVYEIYQTGCVGFFSSSHPSLRFCICPAIASLNLPRPNPLSSPPTSALLVENQPRSSPTRLLWPKLTHKVAPMNVFATLTPSQLFVLCPSNIANVSCIVCL